MIARRHVGRSHLRQRASAIRGAFWAACWCFASVPARAGEGSTRVPVRVVEVAAGRAYLELTQAALVRPGDQVEIGRAKYAVVAANQKHLAIEIGNAVLGRGQRGIVSVTSPPPRALGERLAPRPLASFVGVWAPPPRPAGAQSVAYIPLGAASDEGTNRARFEVDYDRIQPLSGPAAAIGRTRLRSVLHAELPQLPLSLDADATAELWQASDLAQRPQNASRPWLAVEQLELGYHGEAVQGALGRLRYASSTLGMLDGARVSAPLGAGVSLGAFGGTLANPLDGSPSTDATRFGTELAWQSQDSSSLQRASLGLQGSHYLGQMDERRVSASYQALPSLGRFGAHAELSFFDANNPWAAPTIELTALGADASVRLGSLRLGAAFDVQSPERSLWLAAFLPPGYFCVARPVPGALDGEPCIGGDRSTSATLDAAWEAERWTVDAGASFAKMRYAWADQNTAFVHGQRRELFGLLRLDAGASVSRGAVIESAALDLGMGVAARDDVADVSLYYRPSLLRYRAEERALLEHGVGSRFWWALSRTLDLNGSVEVLTGADVDVLLLQLGATFRPRF